MRNVIVALDAMGGDFGPKVTVPAAIQALSLFPELKIILTGDRNSIKSCLLFSGYQSNTRLSIEHTKIVVSDSKRPSLALRSSVGSSMEMAINLVSSNLANACVSGGNTGALMALSCFRLKLLPGLERPALVSALPTKLRKKTWMLDLGANVSSDAESLFQFAIMGSALAEQHLRRSARVAILNVGVEEIKGNNLVKRCSEMLSKSKLVNFIGYIEGNQLLYDVADVIVCDGFVGNICLKVCEGTAKLFIDKLKNNVINSSIKGWIAKKLFSELFDELRALNPDRYNGASFLGLRGVVIKSHGKADVSAIVNAIGEAVYEVQEQVSTCIRDRLKAVLLERKK
ncbi:phosphate acyltransferase [Candidatus Photodesmus blepharus]|uniref:Phosphate acyltransferase n=1 Tax=Candidatus Photodesmus blepharonis TaxID=1179155 RepID=A0A084CN22_9GAMM|nr:phosphate acyltransferase PlsX [Candidatus Photodesmus blepharus]KEY91201.1 phosphate acyltransferase [Candidatus Photodesmus blepharus]